MIVAPAAAVSANVVSALYVRTRDLHLKAERTGIISDILHGKANRDGYTLLLRNLHPAYQEIEDGIARHRDNPILRPLVELPLGRTPAIEADLVALGGEDWRDRVPLLPEGEAYAIRVRDAARGDGSRLIAHAYTRYLGDLNGGLVMCRLLQKSLGLGAHELAHYDFSAIADAGGLKANYRRALELAGAAAPDPEAIVAEGTAAFLCNIALSVAVQRSLAEQAGQQPH